MSKARELANLGNAYSDGALSNRNRIINGSFQIWQRGTSFTSDGYGADRWSMAFGSNTGTISRQSFTVGQTDVPDNPAYYLRFNISSYSSEFSIFNKVEDVSTLAGQTAVLSFYMKADSAVTNRPFIVQNFGSGGSSNVNSALSTVSVTTSWQRFEVPFSVPSISGKTIGSSSYLQIMPLRITSSFTGNIDIANVQLEVGDTATPFEHRSYGQELALCQRYFYKITDGGSAAYIADFFVYSSTNTTGIVPLPVTMRAAPTLTGNWTTSGYFVGYANQAAVNWTTITLNGSNTRVGTVYHSGGGYTIGSAGGLYVQPEAILAYDAEL